MRWLIPRRGGLSGGLIAILSVAALLVRPPIARAQTQPGADQPPLTDRERSLLERIQNLEKELAALRDLQARLAALEAKIGNGAPNHDSATPADAPAASAAAPGSPAVAPLLWIQAPAISPIQSAASSAAWPKWNLPLRGSDPHWVFYYSPASDLFFVPHLTPNLFGRGVLTLAQPQPAPETSESLAADNGPTSTPSTPPPPQSAPRDAAGQQPPKQPGAQSSAGNLNAGNDFLEASSGNPGMFGEFNPGRGFVVGRNSYGELDLSGYMAVRYLDQMPPRQSATDHLGRWIPVNPRRDFQFHRVMLFFQGWLFSPKFRYQAFVWTVQDTNQVAVGGALTYSFSKYLTLGGGWNAYPGTQSLQGSHPYWESYDRVMADEFFRPYFSQGLFAQGILLPRLEYRWLVGNNLSNLDVPAVKLDRNFSGGGALTWLPTTGEFGPRGAFGDYESHEKLATRFNFAYTFSPEDRQAPLGTPIAANTTIRLADSLNIFDTGALANGVTVEKVHYNLISAAAGIKYRGFWLQGEGYGRKLDHLIADGPLPVSVVKNTGFYVQAAYMIVPKRGELYASTSYVLGEFGRHPHEFIFGGNYYPWNTRNLRLNVQLINLSRSPVSSTFGFYTGQITGPVFSVGFTAFY